MLRKIRIALAALCFVLITLLFLDFTGWAQAHFGFLAKIQFLPAFLALNVLVLLGLVLTTLLLGRVYCSVVCPLGVMQDVVNRLRCMAGKRARNRFSFSRSKTIVRCAVLVVFAVCMAAGLGWLASLIAPYSAYGRMVQTLAAPVYDWVNNIFADRAAATGSYVFYRHDTVTRLPLMIVVAAATFAVVFATAWIGGRAWCNTVCPVGTVLGFLSRYSFLAPVIDTDKCVGCSLCARRCKASCIDYKAHRIDYSKCVASMDCIDNCTHNAIKYTKRRSAGLHKRAVATDKSRRRFLSAGAMLVGAAAMKAADKTADGGLAKLENKIPPKRTRPVLPPGAVSIEHFTTRCTACQLCVTACPTQILRPSTSLSRLMKPESVYENGYCRPECTRCGDVCPAGAIHPLTVERKSSTQIGHAVWTANLCFPVAKGLRCGNCARHCPVGAISMVPYNRPDGRLVYVPAVDTERCIGCGACEYVCPSRPQSAIYVDGNEVQRMV